MNPVVSRIIGRWNAKKAGRVTENAIAFTLMAATLKYGYVWPLGRKPVFILHRLSSLVCLLSRGFAFRWDGYDRFKTFLKIFRQYRTKTALRALCGIAFIFTPWSSGCSLCELVNTTLPQNLSKGQKNFVVAYWESAWYNTTIIVKRWCYRARFPGRSLAWLLFDYYFEKSIKWPGTRPFLGLPAPGQKVTFLCALDKTQHFRAFPIDGLITHAYQVGRLLSTPLETSSYWSNK